MLGRTLLHNNARECYLAGCAKAGSDIVTVSVSGDCCDACGRYENELLSITGETPGLPTLQEAMDDGLFHPNCTHRIIAVPESIARKYYGMGEGGKSSGQSQKNGQTRQSGQTRHTGQHAPLGFFGGRKPERFEGKLFQGDLTPEAAKLKEQLEKAGAAPEQIDAILWNHNAKMQELMGRAPKYFFHDEIGLAETIPGTTETHLAKSPNDWNGHPMTITHEYGHSIFNTLLKKHPELIEQFNQCVEKDKAAVLQQEWAQRCFDCIGVDATKKNCQERLTKEFFGKDKDFSKLSTHEEWQVVAKADILGDITNGEYGFGHLAYGKDFSEAFSNMYVAVKYEWPSFEKDYKNMWDFVKGLIND